MSVPAEIQLSWAIMLVGGALIISVAALNPPLGG